jgi:hypothetical protein
VLPQPEHTEATHTGYWGGGFEVDRQSLKEHVPKHQQYKRQGGDAGGESPDDDDAAAASAYGITDAVEDLTGSAAKKAQVDGRTLAQKFLEKKFGKMGELRVDLEPPKPAPRPVRAPHEEPILLPRRGRR